MGDVPHPAAQRERWAEGATIADPSLAEAVASVWAEALRMSGEDATPDPPRSYATAQQMISEASVTLVDVLEVPGSGPDPFARHVRAGHLLAALNAVSADLRDAHFAQRTRAFGQVNAAVGRLRAVGGITAMLEGAAAEVCRCGFDRALLLRVEAGVATLAAAHDVAGADHVAELLRAGRATPIRVDHALPEAEMIRRRGPLLVRDVRDLPNAHRGLIAATGTRSYVAAPVFSQGHLLAIVLADCLGSRRRVDTFDRDMLWLFAQGLGSAYERAGMLERLAALRQEVRRANHSILAVMDEFVDADVEVARIDREDGALSSSAATVFVAVDSRIERVLTPRERDVAGLMAAGETNAGIAAKLVVSEATVKSHVKHILRKLRASNRAEAVSRIIQLSQGPGSAG